MQTCAKSDQTIFVKIAVNTLEICSAEKTARQKSQELKTKSPRYASYRKMWKHFTQSCAETLWLKVSAGLFVEKYYIFNIKDCKIIAELNTVCFNNVIIQYGEQFHTTKKHNYTW